jgi:hypothetical protein
VLINNLVVNPIWNGVEDTNDTRLNTISYWLNNVKHH